MQPSFHTMGIMLSRTSWGRTAGLTLLSVQGFADAAAGGGAVGVDDGLLSSQGFCVAGLGVSIAGGGGGGEGGDGCDGVLSSHGFCWLFAGGGDAGGDGWEYCG